MLDPGQYFVVVDSAAPRRFGRFRLNARMDSLAEAEHLCTAALPITPGHTVTGTTSGTGHFEGTCGNSRSPENLYRFRLTRRSSVRLALTSTTPGYDCVLYVRATCADGSTERACNDDSGDTVHSLVETTLDPGTYTVFVDGYGPTNMGGYSLEFQASPAAPGSAPLQSPVVGPPGPRRPVHPLQAPH